MGIDYTLNHTILLKRPWKVLQRFGEKNHRKPAGTVPS